MLRRTIFSSFALFFSVASWSCGEDGLPLAGPSDGGPRADVPIVDTGPMEDVEIRMGCRALRETITEDEMGDTWNTWARDDFFAVYCVRCHSTMNEGDERNGAPPGYNWDDRDSVYGMCAPGMMCINQIRYAATIINYMPFMPGPGDPVPSCEERYRLARWIDNGAPE